MPEYKKDLLVSIVCITYNHGKYVEESLKGFLSQDVDFEIEIIIGDDCSTDNTREIIKKYHNLYPDKIKPIYNEDNIGINKNFIKTLESATGKYIALCEGDDYWIDNNKLQKQVDFMEENLEYTMCFHRSETFDDISNKVIELYPNIDKELDLDIYDFIESNKASTASVLYRNIDINLPKSFFDFKLGDWPMHLLYLEKGKAKYLPNIMSRYRVHINGVWSLNNEAKKLSDVIYMLEKMNEFFEYRYNKYFLDILPSYYYKLYKAYIQENANEDAERLYEKVLKELKYNLKDVFKEEPFLKRMRYKSKKIRYFIKDFIQGEK
jgi:glycosyltransferase involved in cell wall biosynthesis